MKTCVALRRGAKRFEVGAGDVPDEVARFLELHIRSVMQLEMLMLLAREPQRWWTADSIHRELRSSVQGAALDLQALANEGLARASDAGERRYRFELARPEDALVMERLSELFRTHFHAVIHSVYAGRRRSMHAFADAFRIKKPGRDGDA